MKGSRYCATHNGQIISWLLNGNGPETCNYHVQGENDRSDPYTDHFAGHFVDNPTQMINAVCPPNPKFNEGDMVRFKNNKRQIRLGDAGKIGVVLNVIVYNSPYYSVLIPGEGSHQMHTSQRDLELMAVA
ncbi:MAG TPA: hypothetical protein EYG51_22270 [Pseudomonadales bacterium]|nr:hypothetical protein [Pseudomonadales bacterium]